MVVINHNTHEVQVEKLVLRAKGLHAKTFVVV